MVNKAKFFGVQLEIPHNLQKVQNLKKQIETKQNKQKKTLAILFNTAYNN